MQRRHAYVLLFALPALLAAAIGAAVSGAAVAGVLWLFVLGDDPWPSWVDTAFALLLIVVGVTLFAGLLVVAYRAGERQEGKGPMNRRHVQAAAGVTALLGLLVVLQQWSVGNLGTPSDGQRCADYCRARGHMASGMPPRDSGPATCSCFDERGHEAIRRPIGDIEAGRGR